MPIDDESPPFEQPSRADVTLTRIADILGCTVESLTGEGNDPIFVQGASELLDLWGAIDDDRDRKRLLEFARTLAKAR